MVEHSEQTTAIDEYIKAFPDDVKTILEEVRRVIRDVAPDAVEAIAYGIPTFKLNGKNMVHFGGWKTHIGFYPTPSGTATFQTELAPYKFAKGSIQFPLDQPIPYDLIKKIARYRIQEIQENSRAR